MVVGGWTHAGEFPSRPIRIIVPTAPSGAGDLVAREMGARLSQTLRVPIVIENKPGASGVIGTDFVAHATPDGYTLLLATSATHVISSQVIARLPYDPLGDFAPVIAIGYATSVLVVSSSLPVSSVRELIAYAQERPGQLNYASSGVGSANHIDTEAFSALTGIVLTHVPYRGTADGYRALIADEVQVMFAAVTSALPYIKSEKVRALVVLSDRRSPLLPAVPTIAEEGMGRIDVRKFFGVLAPAGTPGAIVSQLNRAMVTILQEPDMRIWMDRQGFETAGGSPADFDHLLRTDFPKWAGTVRALGLRAE
jgi:tripartite-type tricarboxylate transporter receptor subunit TctC